MHFWLLCPLPCKFTRRIPAPGILKKRGQKEKTSSCEGAYFYVFEKNKYEKMAKKGELTNAI